MTTREEKNNRRQKAVQSKIKEKQEWDDLQELSKRMSLINDEYNRKVLFDSNKRLVKINPIIKGRFYYE